MALTPRYSSAFRGQVARNTYGAPNYNAPPAAATPFQRIAIPASASGTAAWNPPTAAAAPAPGPSLTVNQAANRQVNQILAPQLAAQAAYGKQQNAAIQQFALALMGKLQPIAGQVGADWNQAIGQTGALANQAATFLQQANPTPQVQALLQSAGAPEAQQQQLAGQLGQTFGGGAAVLNFLGGAVPGAEMATDKAAAQSQAAQYPALAALRGQQDLASALWQQSTNRANIEANRGQLYATARQNILQNNAARQTAAATAAYRGAQLRQGQQKITQAGRLGAAKLTQAGQIAKAKLTQAGQATSAKAAETRRHDVAGEQIGAARVTATAAHQSAQETQARINEIDKTTNQKVTALIAEGFDPATGQLTPKTQVAIDRIQASATAAKDRLVEQHRVNTARINQGAQRVAISAQNAQTARTRAQTARTQGAARIAQGQQRIGLEAQSVATSARRERAYERSQAFKQQAKQRGISATSYANLRKQALGRADLFYYGKAPTNTAGTNGVPGIDYGPALRQLVDGYSLSKADAQAILNDFYAPGERGRPAASPVTVKSKGPFGVTATASP